LLWLVKMADFVKDDPELQRALEEAWVPSRLVPRIRAAMEDAEREMRDIFSADQISFHQAMAQVKKTTRLAVSASKTWSWMIASIDPKPQTMSK